jgi:DNA-binding transcriptional LysR family regulator
MLTLDELLSFVLFSEELNFTRAAVALNISQPSLHAKINKLADTLGVPLYRRIGRRLELTPAGIETARFGREMDERTATFAREIRSGPSPASVVLAAGEGSYLYLLDDGIRRFRRRSTASLRLLTRDSSGVVEVVRSGIAQLGVTPLDSAVDGIERQLLARVSQVLVLPRRHALAKKKAVSLRDLAGQRLIVPPGDRPLRVALGRALQSAGVDWQPAVEATGWPLMIHFVGLGLGLAIVNGFCRTPPDLVTRPIDDLPRIHYFLINRTGVPAVPAVTQLRTALLQGAARLPKVRH